MMCNLIGYIKFTCGEMNDLVNTDLRMIFILVAGGYNSPSL